jgi:hypothetical protein
MALAILYARIFLPSQSLMPMVNDLLLGFLLYQSRLVPRVLPLLAFIGAPAPHFLDRRVVQLLGTKVQADGARRTPGRAIYVDHGLTGTHRDRPGLRLALAACRAGDTLVVTKLDRLARSLPDARDILDELTRWNVKLDLGGSIHDPTDPVGRPLFNVLVMVAKFESDLIRLRTREE